MNLWVKSKTFLFEEKTVIWLLSGVLALPTAFFLYLGSFMRPLADDYCTLAVVHWNGFWDTLFKYFGMRYGASIFSYFIAMFDEGVYRWMVLVLLISFLGILALFSRKYLEFKKISEWLPILCFGLLSFVTLMILTPNKLQSIYWFGASTVYTWPIIFFLLSVFLLLISRDSQKKYSKLLLVISVVLFFFSFGFSEVFAMATVPVLGMIALIGLFKRKRLVYYLLPLVVNIFSIVFMFFLPARTERINMLANIGIVYKPTPVKILTSSLHGTILQFEDFLRLHNLFFILSLIALTIYLVLYLIEESNFKQLPSKITLWLLLLAVPFGAWASLIPGYMVYGGGGPDRERVVFTFLIIFASLLVSILAARFLGPYIKGTKRVKLTGSVLLLLFAIVFVMGVYSGYELPKLSPGMRSIPSKLVADISFYKMIGKNFDQTDAYIRAQNNHGIKNIIVAPIGLGDRLNDFVADKGFWVNVCAARYYGVDSLTVQK